MAKRSASSTPNGSLPQPKRSKVMIAGQPPSRPFTPASLPDERHPTLQRNAATAIISQYVGQLRNNLTEHNSVYTCSGDVVDGFRCTLELPFNCPVRKVESEGSFRSKQLAKQSAAYSAALQLIDAGEISESLIPTPANPTVKKAKLATVASGTHLSQTNGTVVCGDHTTTSPRYKHPEEVIRNAVRAELPKSQNSRNGIIGEEEYPYFSTSRWWTQSPRLCTRLCPAMITLSFSGTQAQKTYADNCRPLVMLTSRPLPLLEDGPFDLDISQVNMMATATLSPFKQIQLTEEQLQLAFRYTVSLFRAQLNKAMTGQIDDSAYVILPLNKVSRSSFSVDDIAWDEVAMVEGPFTSPFTLHDLKQLEEETKDAMVSSPSEFGRRFYVANVRHDLSPTSLDPNFPDKSFIEVATSQEPWEYRNRVSNNITWPDQPMLEGEVIVSARSGGVVASLVDMQRRKVKLLIPEFLERYWLPASTYRTATALIATLSALDDELIANDLSAALFEGKITRALAREATACPGSSLAPVAKNYERLEILGDTILKLAVSSAVFSDMKKSEGAMTFDRHKVVSNRALQRSVIASGVVPFIRSVNRRARDFTPPGWKLQNSEEVAPSTQKLGDKTVADVGEALIGAAYLSAGGSMQAALDAMHIMCIPLSLRNWTDMPRTGPVHTEEPLTLLGYTFQDPSLGRTAISLSNDPPRKCRFERLEFLGDAVLDYLTLGPLWSSNPHLRPAPLTHMKHSRVANSAFSAFLIHAGLDAHFTDVDMPTKERLDAFTTSIRAARAKADTLKAAGRESFEFWNNVPAHKWLGDIVEALFGAIFEDSGFDLEVVKRVYSEHLQPFIEQYAIPPAAHSLHPKSVLLELFAVRKCHAWSIERGPAPNAPSGHIVAAVIVHDTPVGSAIASGTTLAVRNACQDALETLKEVTTCPCV